MNYGEKNICDEKRALPERAAQSKELTLDASTRRNKAQYEAHAGHSDAMITWLKVNIFRSILLLSKKKIRSKPPKTRSILENDQTM